MDAWPAVARLGGDIGQPGASIFVDVAALFATHPLESKVTNFGDTCRTVASDNMGRIIESHERRFRRLLASDSVGDLTTQLRVWVRLASSKGIGVNYESLFYDLWKWRWDADGIRVKWARSFWHSGNHEAKDTTLTETAPKDSVSREA
jgi:CRISPR type I-E-associated protein CasB/Cse2